jgi:predicted RNA-binding protein with RPS1 domain
LTWNRTVDERTDISIELNRLLELCAKYPEVGPPLAELAFKLGQGDFANRVVRMGLESGAHGLEYFFVAVNAARREDRVADALAMTLDAVRTFAAAPAESLAGDDGVRLLHLVRHGFSTLLFDVKDVNAHPEFARGLAELLPALEGRLGADPFYHALLAQTLWLTERPRSENAWDRAIELGNDEHTWNARGTWYKEAEKDLDKAEKAYRAGLEAAPHSALLLHNVAQVLVDKASKPDVDVKLARRLLREADELLRSALREDGPKGLRRHIHTTRDRLHDLRQSLPQGPQGGEALPERGERAERPERERPEPEPERDPPQVGETVKGRVVSLTQYGAFVAVGGGHVGLLHKSEMAHGPVGDPASLFKVGDEVEVKVLEVEKLEKPEGGGRGGRKWRIGLSRRALLPAPPPGERRQDERPHRGERRDDRDRRDDRRGRDDRRDDDRHGARRAPAPPPVPVGTQGSKFRTDGRIASLGEMLLKKLEEQKGGK